MRNKDYTTYFQKPDAKKARKRLTQTTDLLDFADHPPLKPIGANKKYLIATFGCQSNEADSETIAGLLETMQFVKTTDESDADVIILNTCAIRESAENRVFGEIGRLKKYKRHHPDLILAVAGCMPQDETVVERLLKTYPHVDIIFGTHNIHKLPEYLETAMFSKERVVEVYSVEGQIVEKMPQRRQHQFKAWVNIMYGCDEFCTYCIVPYTRGKERSREPADILREIAELEAKGYQEITLLGQNVNAYGRDFVDKDYVFKDLINDIATLKIPRVRFMTSHPRDFDEATVIAIKNAWNLMPHIHLPVQSGSNHILKKMNRKYTKESYLALVDFIYQEIPDASITTDIIVGFPGETDADFLETLDLVKKSRFEGAFTFIFSPRANTPAALFPDETSDQEKKDRLKRLNEIINQGYQRGHQRFQDETVEILVDGPSKYDDAVLAGYSSHGKLVNVKAPKSVIGSLIPVKITTAKTWHLEGIYE